MTAHIEVAEPHVMTTYGRVAIALERGQGCRLWDVNGKEYLDALGGIAVNTLGHNHPKFVPALQEQVARLIHCSNYYHIPGQEQLATLLTERAGMDKAFFCSTGLEANEAAIKLVRKWAASQGRAPDQRVIVTFRGSFHGRTLAAVTATAQPKYQEGYEPLPGGFRYVDFNDVTQLEIAMSCGDVAAVMLEPVQGEGGVMPAASGFLRAVRELCDHHGALLVLDEIQAGMGRTGTLFAHWQDGVVPDIVTLAKALGGGFPIGAMLAGPKVAQAMQFGAHGTTFGGNPLSMRAGIETIRIMEEDGLLEHTARVGAHLKARLQQELSGIAGVVEVRGQGLIIGVELAKPCGALLGLGAEAGLLFSVTADTVVRLVPPLIMTEAEADEVVARLKPLIQKFLAQ